MSQYSLAGKDTIVFSGLGDISEDLANGDVGSITIPNELINMAVGKNSNAIYALDEEGKRFNMIIRVLKGSKTDVNMLNKYHTSLKNFAELILLNGTLTKQLGDGFGNLKYWTFSLEGVAISKAPGAKINVNGDVEQAVTEYELIGVVKDINIG